MPPLHTTPSYLIGSTEQVSDNIQELRALERRDDVTDDRSVVLHVEEQMARDDVRRARLWMRDASGVPELWEMGRVRVMDAIQVLRSLRWEQSALQEWQ